MPLQVPGLPQLHPSLVFADGNNRQPYNLDTMNFGPRVGLAYCTPGNIVIRTGYGRFCDPIKGAASGTGGGGFTGFSWNTPLLLTAQNDGATPQARISNRSPSARGCPQAPRSAG